MTSLEMYQKFEVYMDKVDSQDLPEIYPEQVFIFLNSAVNEYVQAIRVNFEKTSKIADDALSLVKRVYIGGITEEDRIRFNYDQARLTRDYTTYNSVYYIMNGRFEASYTNSQGSTINGITDINFIQQDDITPALSDPFNRANLADRVPCVREDNALLATPPKFLSLNQFVGTAILKPAVISQSTNCDLREQIHESIVNRAVQKALENVESIRQRTFDK